MNDKKEFQDLYTIFIERKKNLITLLQSKQNTSGLYNVVSEVIQRLISVSDNLERLYQEIRTINEKSILVIVVCLDSLNSEMEYLFKNFDDANLNIFNTSIANTLSEIQAIKINILASEDQNAKFEEILKKYQTTINRLEIDTDVLDFKATANLFDKQGKRWLVVVVIIFGSLLGISIFFFTQIWSEITHLTAYANIDANDQDIVHSILYYDMFKLVFVKLLLLSILIYSLKFAMTNYLAAMHNKTINQHKGNSLVAAERMIRVLGYDNAEVRNHILILASKEIFVQEKTGYLLKEDKIDFSIIEKLVSIGKKEN